jgi:hypothetical protein
VPARESAPQTGEDRPRSGRRDATESDEVLQYVNRLPLVDKACKQRRCSLTVDNDGQHWIVAVGSDRAPAGVMPLHLFSVLVEPGSRKAVAIDPGAPYGFCSTPITIEKWPHYAAAYERYLDNRGPEPACP